MARFHLVLRSLSHLADSSIFHVSSVIYAKQLFTPVLSKRFFFSRQYFILLKQSDCFQQHQAKRIFRLQYFVIFSEAITHSNTIQVKFP